MEDYKELQEKIGKMGSTELKSEWILSFFGHFVAKGVSADKAAECAIKAVEVISNQNLEEEKFKHQVEVDGKYWDFKVKEHEDCFGWGGKKVQRAMDELVKDIPEKETKET